MALRCAVIELALIDAGLIVPPTSGKPGQGSAGITRRETLLTRDMNDFLKYG
jgi:hypothetical protein